MNKKYLPTREELDELRVAEINRIMGYHYDEFELKKHRRWLKRFNNVLGIFEDGRWMTNKEINRLSDIKLESLYNRTFSKYGNVDLDAVEQGYDAEYYYGSYD